MAECGSVLFIIYDFYGMSQMSLKKGKITRFAVWINRDKDTAEHDVSFSAYWASQFNMRSAGMAKRSNKHVDNGLTVLRAPQPTSQAEGELWRMEASAVFGPCQVCLQGFHFHEVSQHVWWRRWRNRQQLLTLLPGGLVCACVFSSKMAPTFHSPLSLPLLTSAALRFKNSDTVVRAPAAAQPQPTQNKRTHCVCAKVQQWHALTKPHRDHVAHQRFLLRRPLICVLPSLCHTMIQLKIRETTIYVSHV